MNQNRRIILGLVGIVLLSLSATLPSAHQRGHYGDDFPVRYASLDGVWSGCQQYWERVGYIRPVGYINLMMWHRFGWSHPTIVHSIVGALHAATCLLLFLLALRVSCSATAALISAAVFACWHSSTMVTSWITSGAMILPSAACLIIAFLYWHRHLTAIGERKPLIGAVLFYACCLGFYDQSIMMPMAFTGTAILWCQRGHRWVAVVRSLGFWAISGIVGVISVFSSSESDRPLTIAWDHAFRNTISLAGQFMDMTIVQPIQSARYGSPPLGWLTEMWTNDRGVLCAATVVFCVGLILFMRAARDSFARPHTARLPDSRLRNTTLVGLLIGLAATATFALSPEATHFGRHTFIPAAGLCMALGALLARLSLSFRPMVVSVSLVTILIPMSAFRVTSTYSWTLQSRTLNTILATLEAEFPDRHDECLIVIDGVRNLGRAFADSWGMTYALKLAGRECIDVSTYLRLQNGVVYANAIWDQTMPILAEKTRVFLWDQTTQQLRPSSLTEYKGRHPEQFPPIATANHQYPTAQ